MGCPAPASLPGLLAGAGSAAGKGARLIGSEGWIIVKRSQLKSLADFAGTVLHELSHALSGAPDMSFEFEQQLTAELGGIVARNITDV